MAACAPLAGTAQTTMRQLWVEMPDTLLPHLNKNLRQECIDFVDMGVKADVDNLLSGKTVMDTLTDVYTHVRLSESAELELRLLPLTDTSRVVCMVKTLRAPEPESSVAFFDMTWNRLDDDFGLKDVIPYNMVSDTPQRIGAFLHRPDTMTQERFEEIASWIDPMMLSAALSPSDDIITFSLSFPITTREERLQLCAVAKERRWRWTGGRFVELKRP